LKFNFLSTKSKVDGKNSPIISGLFDLSSLGNLITNGFDGESNMLKNDHLGFQENDQEPITRPQLKRLILEYLQKRSRKEILLEEPCDEGSGSLE
jgi:hypothetical protein